MFSLSRARHQCEINGIYEKRTFHSKYAFKSDSVSADLINFTGMDENQWRSWIENASKSDTNYTIYNKISSRSCYLLCVFFPIAFTNLTYRYFKHIFDARFGWLSFFRSHQHQNLLEVRTWVQQFLDQDL